MLKVDDNGEYLNPPVFYLLNHVNAYCYSIMNLYRVKRVPIDVELECVQRLSAGGDFQVCIWCIG